VSIVRILIAVAGVVVVVALVAVLYAPFVLSGTIAQREEDEQGIRRS
jgi:hypothetical protein